MTRTKEGDAGSAVPTVNELLAQRAQVLGWLERLDEVDDGESRRVVERVRSDYQGRLQGVVQELSRHLESLRGELEGARERLRGAEGRHEEADDALREARLRHRIGELPAGAWEARRPELEEAVEQAAGERAAAADEVERLEEVLAQIDAGVLAPGPRPRDAEATLPEGPAAPPRIEAFQAVAEPEPVPFLAPAEDTLLEPGGEEQDLAFLEELDRAIAASTDSGMGAEEEAEEPEAETRPRKGTKCPDCGYTNDADAWYCGVCGVDLA